MLNYGQNLFDSFIAQGNFEVGWVISKESVLKLKNNFKCPSHLHINKNLQQNCSFSS